MKAYYRERLSVIFRYLSTILIIGGILLVLPFIIGIVYGEQSSFDQLIQAFLLPGGVAAVAGLVARAFSRVHSLSLKDSMFICTLSWILLTLIGAVPFVVILHVSYLDACFETMSGFTTTGITVLTGLDTMPHSILFWRALTQWIGGLGILSMFLLIGFKGGAAANKLFLAESHKITSKSPSPGMFRTAKILWTMYISFTVAETLILLSLGLHLFDAATHAFTTISTGGYSIYDNSIAQYRIAGFAHADLIELTILLFMLFGGINFFIHYRVWTGSPKALWDNTELRYFWSIIIGGIILMFLSQIRSNGFPDFDHVETTSAGFKTVLIHLKTIAFQVVSIITTTGYATQDINSVYFTAFAKQAFLVLMVIGGCAGSTGGGIKVIRVAVLTKLVKNRIIKLNSSRLTRHPLTIDSEKVDDEELRRIFTLFFMWIVLLVIGGGITAFFSNLSGWQSFSGMFSALGNIGPCYISVQEMIALHPVIKITFILGMLAGRLEILPVLLIFSKKFFK
ncbi:MAG: TrkH family potassium uptake protein [bacterium]